MAAVQDYRCTECKKLTKREVLTVKKVQFLEIGVKGKTLKTRTAAWLCPKCVVKDEHWKLEAYDAPGLRDDRERATTPAKSLLTPDSASAIMGPVAQTPAP